MTESSAEGDPAARATRLRELIAFHNLQYYQLDAPEVPDAEYDALVRELRAIEAEHPDLAVADSPTGSVGAPVSTLFSPVAHRVPMMSLDNAIRPDELQAWADRLAKRIPADTTFVCELKIDGLAMSLTYEDGRYVQAATRGDGNVGEDVTANVATIADIPAVLAKKVVAPAVIEVRGEVYMPSTAFEELNRRQEEAGGRLFVNPRNSAAGSLRQKDASITASRALSFWAYQVGDLQPRTDPPGGAPQGPGQLPVVHPQVVEAGRVPGQPREPRPCAASTRRWPSAGIGRSTGTTSATRSTGW